MEWDFDDRRESVSGSYIFSTQRFSFRLFAMKAFWGISLGDRLTTTLYLLLTTSTTKTKEKTTK